MKINNARALLPSDGRISTISSNILIIESDSSFVLAGALSAIAPFYPITSGFDVLLQQNTTSFSAGLYAFDVYSYSMVQVISSGTVYFRLVTTSFPISPSSGSGGSGGGSPGPPGPSGLSAYQVWLLQPGNAGKTEAQFLASLTGPPGSTGATGAIGAKGDKGDSAYTIAVQEGFVGTVQEWLNSLKGLSSYQTWLALGNTGTEQDFVNSISGASAYQLAVQEGFTGTLPEWLNSLVGPQGIQGVQGDTGASAYDLAVSAGFLGTLAEWLLSIEGESAYQIWLSLGNTGTEQDFIDSLKGPKGDAGSATGLPNEDVLVRIGVDNEGNLTFDDKPISITVDETTIAYNTNNSLEAIGLKGNTKTITADEIIEGLTITY